MHHTCQYSADWQQKIKNYLKRDDKLLDSVHWAVICPSFTVYCTFEEDAPHQKAWLLAVPLGKEQ